MCQQQSNTFALHTVGRTPGNNARKVTQTVARGRQKTEVPAFSASGVLPPMAQVKHAVLLI